MARIEYKLETAQRKREQSAHRKLQNVEPVDSKIKDAQSRHMNINEKNEYQMLVSVVLKHHNKEKTMKKKAKEKQEIREFEQGKKHEESQLFKNKLNQARMDQDQKTKQLNQRIKKIESKKEELTQALEDYKNEKQEFGNQKSEDHQKKMRRIHKERQTYKAHLVKKLLEKSLKGHELTQTKKIASEYAFRQGAANSTLNRQTSADHI